MRTSSAETLEAAAGGYGDLPLVTITPGESRRPSHAPADRACRAIHARPSRDRREERPLDTARRTGN
jgi:hypothetical protein